MGANSIDISQYRGRIGTFTSKKLNHNTRKVGLTNSLKSSNKTESFIILSYLLVMSNITQNLLIMSGVELNPGPFYLGKKYIMWMLQF